MIGIVKKSSSLRSSLDYCLKDKLTPAREGEERKVAYKQRAEIIRFNQCYGSQRELVQQFREVVQLNQNVCEPYLNVTLGLPPQDRLSNSQWADVSAGCARALGFEDHQYLAILHKDTDHQHVHILANRIDFEGKINNDLYLFAEIHQFCRQTEWDYQLTQSLGPRCYQTQEQRQQERQDPRVIHLKQSIGGALETACSFPAFEEQMQQRGYKIYRNENGIAFYSEKLITLRGYEADYPWKKIESILEQNEILRLEQEQKLAQELNQRQELPDDNGSYQRQRLAQEEERPGHEQEQRQSQERAEEEVRRHVYRQRIHF